MESNTPHEGAGLGRLRGGAGGLLISLGVLCFSLGAI